MNRGVLYKGVREAMLATIACGIGLMIFEAIVGNIFWTFQEEFVRELGALEFLEGFINSLIGAQLGGDIGPQTLQALAYVHPLVLALIFAHEITLCTRVPAGEIDRGTADVLFTLPITRFSIFLSETVLWLGSGFVVLGFGFAGSLIGFATIPAEGRIELRLLCMIFFNLYLLYLTVGALTLCISAHATRRGPAIGLGFGIVLALFIMNFLAEYSDFVKRINVVNILSYYKPLPILSDEKLAVADLAVLFVCAVILWIAAALRIVNRDIATL